MELEQLLVLCKAAKDSSVVLNVAQSLVVTTSSPRNSRPPTSEVLNPCIAAAAAIFFAMNTRRIFKQIARVSAHLARSLPDGDEKRMAQAWAAYARGRTRKLSELISSESRDFAREWNSTAGRIARAVMPASYAENIVDTDDVGGLVDEN